MIIYCPRVVGIIGILSSNVKVVVLLFTSSVVDTVVKDDNTIDLLNEVYTYLPKKTGGVEIPANHTVVESGIPFFSSDYLRGLVDEETLRKITDKNGKAHLEVLADIIAGAAGHHGIRHHHVGIGVFQADQRGIGVADGDYLVTLIAEDALTHALGVRAVVHQQNAAHFFAGAGVAESLRAGLS